MLRRAQQEYEQNKRQRELETKQWEHNKRIMDFVEKRDRREEERNRQIENTKETKPRIATTKY